MATLILKKPVKYGKITLIPSRIKGEYHMFTGLKNQLELSDSLITNILPQDNELVKLKKILNWKDINTIYKSCFTGLTMTKISILPLRKTQNSSCNTT